MHRHRSTSVSTRLATPVTGSVASSRAASMAAVPAVVVAILTTLLALLLIPAAALTAQDREDRPRDGHDLPFLEEEAPELDTLAFTVDEATWLSLDVIPDGSGMVLEILGDLYTLPMEGGEATRITEGMGFDSQPAVSPDGAWVAFISDRDGSDNLWIAPLDPTAEDAPRPRKLSSQSGPSIHTPAWTPDSRYVIASRGGRGAPLWMWHIDGGSGLEVTAAPSGGADSTGGSGSGSRTELGAVVSPDGEWLYFTTQGRAQGGVPGWQISRRNLRTGDTDVITQNEWSAFRPLLSPDGRLMVYGTRYDARTGLRIRDLETGADEWLVYPVQRDQLETGGAPARDLFPGYAFTPDGAHVLYTEGGKIRRVSVAGGEVTTIPFTADVKLAIGPDLENPYRIPQGPVRARLIQSPRQSPDGERLVMSVLTGLYVADLEEGGPANEPRVLQPRRLDTGDAWAFHPIWSPDGDWIAYVTWSVDGGHIWKRRADGGGEPQRLSDVPAFYTDLAWSPDGERIVALRGNAYQRNYTDSEFGGLRIPLDLVQVPAAGGEVGLIVPARGAGVPHFVDGEPDRVYVYSREGLISLRLDGTDRRTHLKVTGRRTPGATSSPAAEAVILSPDRRHALAASSNQLYVVTVPPSTGAAVTVSLTGPSVPVKRLTDIGADYFAWADGGETLTWAIGSTFYRRPLASVSFRDEKEDDAPGGEEDEEESPDEEDEEEDEDEDEEQEAPADLHEAVEAFRAELDFPRATPEGTIVLRGATLITMEGEEVLESHDLVVTDNRIAAMGPAGTVEVPAGAEEMDVEGMFIVPGFIDTHAHWEFRTHDVLEPHNWSLLANLAYGVTAGLDVQTSTNDYFAYQDLVETGQSWGQRAFMTGPGIFSRNNLNSYEEVLAYLRRYREHYRTPNIKSYMVGTREQRQWVVRASKELGLMPTTEGGRNLRLDLTHAVDGMHGNEHTLPVSPLFDDVVQLYARTLTAYTPTLLVLYGGVAAEEWFYTQDGADVHDDEKLNRFTPHVVVDRNTRRRSRWIREDEHVFDDAAAQAAKIQRAGGLVGVGGHGQLQGLGYHWEMWALAMGGMTPREVLQAATIDGARIIGIQEDLGSLAEGKLADLVILQENPLEDIRNTTAIRWVMKNGELYEDDSLTRIWPERMELPPLWWWDKDPVIRRGGPPPS